MIELELDRQLLMKVAGPDGNLRPEVNDWLMNNCGPKLRKDHSGNYITSNSFKGWNYVVQSSGRISRIRISQSPVKFVLQFVYARHAVMFKMKWA